MQPSEIYRERLRCLKDVIDRDQAPEPPDDDPDHDRLERTVLTLDAAISSLSEQVGASRARTLVTAVLDLALADDQGVAEAARAPRRAAG